MWQYFNRCEYWESDNIISFKVKQDVASVFVYSNMCFPQCLVMMSTHSKTYQLSERNRNFIFNFKTFFDFGFIGGYQNTIAAL